MRSIGLPLKLRVYTLLHVRMRCVARPISPCATFCCSTLSSSASNGSCSFPPLGDASCAVLAQQQRQQ
jgi:hypothetical protein